MRVELAEETPLDYLDEELPEMEAAHIDPFTGLNDMAEAEFALADAAFGDPRGRKGEAPTRKIRRPGGRSSGMRRAPVARARSTSIAMGGLIEGGKA